MEALLQNGTAIINLIVVLAAACLWVTSLAHVAKQNKVELSTFKQEFRLEISQIKQDFREETKEIRKELRDETKALSAEIATVRTDVATLRERMDAKFEAIMERLNRGA